MERLGEGADMLGRVAGGADLPEVAPATEDWPVGIDDQHSGVAALHDSPPQLVGHGQVDNVGHLRPGQGDPADVFIAVIADVVEGHGTPMCESGESL